MIASSPLCLPLSALYVSFFQSGCAFRSPSLLTKTRLFSFPPSYGEHKYALPTTRSGCSSPVSFSEYGKVLEEIRYLCRNSSAAASTSPVLKYLRRKGESFVGNLSAKKRKSFFNHSDSPGVDVPDS